MTYSKALHKTLRLRTLTNDVVNIKDEDLTDLNTAIAAFKHSHPADNTDFEHDARLYMALFEEMAKTKSTIHDNLLYVDLYVRSENVFQVYVSHGCMCHEEVTESDTVGAAICLAYMRLHGLE